LRLTHTYDNASRSGFDVANYHQIFPIAHGKLSIPNTHITLDAFVFHDDDLYSNLFGIATLTQHGQSATYTNTDLQISAPTTHGPKIIIYGVKNLNANEWHFSLPKARHHTASQVVRHEQHAELVLYASATFGSPPTKTFYKAVANGWLTNYPTLTAEMVRKNQPHSALGHITVARSGIRSSQPKDSSSKAFVTTRSQAAATPATSPHLTYNANANVSAHPAYQPLAYQLRSHQTDTFNNNLAYQQKAPNA
jgi:hypothetical protein